MSPQREPGQLAAKQCYTAIVQVKMLHCGSSWGTPTRYATNLRHHWLGFWPLMSETTECQVRECSYWHCYYNTLTKRYG
jgi:hypothetical protein